MSAFETATAAGLALSVYYYSEAKQFISVPLDCQPTEGRDFVLFSDVVSSGAHSRLSTTCCINALGKSRGKVQMFTFFIMGMSCETTISLKVTDFLEGRMNNYGKLPLRRCV